MIGSHTAVADTAKSHLRSCQMDDRIVDTSAAKRHFLQETSLQPLVTGKQIQSKRLWSSSSVTPSRTAGEKDIIKFLLQFLPVYHFGKFLIRSAYE